MNKLFVIVLIGSLLSGCGFKAPEKESRISITGSVNCGISATKEPCGPPEHKLFSVDRGMMGLDCSKHCYMGCEGVARCQPNNKLEVKP